MANLFYDEVLRWDYHASMNFPQYIPSLKKQTRNYNQPVPTTFKTAAEYIQVFTNMVLLECWHAIKSPSDEDTPSPVPFTCTLLKTFDYIDSYNPQYGRKRKHQLQGRVSDVFVTVSKLEFVKSAAFCNDLILLSQMPEKKETTAATIFPDPKTPHVFAHIVNVRFKGNHDVTLKVKMIPLHELGFLKEPSCKELECRGFSNLISFQREYTAVMNLPKMVMRNHILKGTVKTINSAKNDNQLLQYTIESFGINQSQAQAVISSQNNSLTLIQGPPGTGKTKTIISLIGSLLSQPNKPVPDNYKILVCAPSNAAVDEIVLRLKDGIDGYGGLVIKPKVLRLGKKESVNVNIHDVTLTAINEKELEFHKIDFYLKQRRSLYESLEESQIQLEAINKQLNFLKETRKKNEKLKNEAKEIQNKLLSIKRKLSECHRHIDNYNSQRNWKSRKAIKDCCILCTTLSGAGQFLVSAQKIDFKTVIIDEAAQAVEASTLIPLLYNCKRLVLVGDPKQLPPTVLSPVAFGLGYGRSLFERIYMNASKSVMVLDTQFRMHPEILNFPNQQFYNGNIKNGAKVYEKTYRKWHGKDSKAFGPLCLFDMDKSHHKKHLKTMSLYNEFEMELVGKLFELLRKILFDNCFRIKKKEKDSIGIISTYKRQAEMLEKKFIKKFGEKSLEFVTFNTVDGFQGQEKDIIILSCVRAYKDDVEDKNVGFLQDLQRMNVALTRAKCSLWVIGNFNTLRSHPTWARLYNSARSRGYVFRVEGDLSFKWINEENEEEKTGIEEQKGKDKNTELYCHFDRLQETIVF